MLCKLPPSRSRHADRELGACPEAALGSQNSGLEPYQCWLQRNLIMQRLALLSWAAAAVALRAPLIGQLATAAGRTVGLLNLLQQAALDDANALATEALAQPHAIAAHAARAPILSSYAQRVEK